MLRHLLAIEAGIVAAGEENPDATRLLKEIADKLGEDYKPGQARSISGRGGLVEHFEALAVAVGQAVNRKEILSYKGVASLVLLNNLAEKVNVAFKSDTTNVEVKVVKDPDEEDDDSYGGNDSYDYGNSNDSY